MIDMDKETLSLVCELVEGNEKAYLSLIDLYYRKLFVYALGLTNEQALAEDIVQNVFMKLWENREKIAIKESLKSFLYKAVYNDFINNYKKKQSSMMLDKLYLETIDELVEEQPSYYLENKIAWMKREIEKLPNKCKQVFLLSKEEGLTNAEIAAYLQLSIKSVEAHITNAYSILREKTESIED